MVRHTLKNLQQMLKGLNNPIHHYHQVHPLEGKLIMVEVENCGRTVVFHFFPLPFSQLGAAFNRAATFSPQFRFRFRQRSF